MNKQNAVITKAPEEPKETRFLKRLKARKQERLDTLVNLFFCLRSGLKDPNGEQADYLYTHYRDLWITECKNFNKSKRRVFTLRGEAFAENVERIIKLEEKAKLKKLEENKIKDFSHWLRRRGGWRHMSLTAFWFWIKNKGDKTKIEASWKTYYVKTELWKD